MSSSSVLFGSLVSFVRLVWNHDRDFWIRHVVGDFPLVAAMLTFQFHLFPIIEVLLSTKITALDNLFG